MNTTRSLPVVLASTSPFRKELLQRLGITFTAATPNVDESPLAGETPDVLVRRLAEAKARAVGQSCAGLMIGSDQVATTGSDILGKRGSRRQFFPKPTTWRNRSSPGWTDGERIRQGYFQAALEVGVFGM